jgi:hypothetical protein
VEPLTAPIAVLDTNALWGRSTRRDLVLALDAGRFIGVWSDWIIAELWRGLAWQWAIQRGPSDAEWHEMGASANRMMRILAPRMRLVSYMGEPDATPWPMLTDPDDEPIWATAVAAHANYVVSANTADFPPNVADPGDEKRHVYFGIRYIEPAQFLNLVWADDPSDVAAESPE